MILNERLAKSILQTKDKSETAYNTIIKLIESTPSGDWDKFVRNNTLRVETYGNFNGEFGIWKIAAELDSESRIAALVASFTGEKSSRKPYADQFTLALSNPLAATPIKQNLVNLTQTRHYNYRFMNPEKNNLTVRDIAKLSRSATIYSFSLSKARDQRTKKTYLLSSEKPTTGLYTFDTSTLGKSEEILEA